MPGGKRSARKSGTKSRAGAASSSAGGAKKKGRKSVKSHDSTPQPPQREPTMFDPPAMENLYYIAHNAVAALEIRGFGSTTPGGKKKKKGGKKGKKK